MSVVLKGYWLFSGERELMPALLRLDHKAVGPEASLERCVLDDHKHWVLGRVVPAAGYSPEGQAVGVTRGCVERGVKVPLANVVI
jgi:hypothetical protein